MSNYSFNKVNLENWIHIYVFNSFKLKMFMSQTGLTFTPPSCSDSVQNAPFSMFLEELQTTWENSEKELHELHFLMRVFH